MEIYEIIAVILCLVFAIATSLFFYFKGANNFLPLKGIFVGKISLKNQTFQLTDNQLKKAFFKKQNPLELTNILNFSDLNTISLKEFEGFWNSRIKSKIAQTIKIFQKNTNINKLTFEEITINVKDRFFYNFIFSRSSSNSDLILLQIFWKTKKFFTAHPKIILINSKMTIKRRIPTIFSKKKIMVLAFLKYQFVKDKFYEKYNLFWKISKIFNLSQNNTRWSETSNFLIVFTETTLSEKDFFNNILRKWNARKNILFKKNVSFYEKFAVMLFNKFLQPQGIKEEIKHFDFALNEAQNSKKPFYFDRSKKEQIEKFENYKENIKNEKKNNLEIKYKKIKSYSTKKIEKYLIVVNKNNLTEQEFSNELLKISQNRIEKLRIQKEISEWENYFLKVSLSWLIINYEKISNSDLTYLIEKNLNNIDKNLLKKIIIFLKNKNIKIAWNIKEVDYKLMPILQISEPQYIFVEKTITNKILRSPEFERFILFVYNFTQNFKSVMIYEKPEIIFDKINANYFGMNLISN